MTEEMESDFVIVTCFMELKNLTSDQIKNVDGDHKSLILEIPRDKISHTTVICLSDIASELGYEECGICADYDTVVVSFDNGSTKFNDDYLEDGYYKMTLFHTYTVKISPDLMCNLIVKKNRCRNLFDFILKQETNSPSIPSKSFLKPFLTSNFMLTLVFFYVFAVVLVVLKWYGNMYSSGSTLKK